MAALALAATAGLASSDNEHTVIHGTVHDASTLEAVPGANVQLGAIQDDSFVPVSGTTTNLEGRFELENQSEGAAAIRVSFVGYHPRVELVFEVQRDSMRLDWVLTPMTREEVDALCKPHNCSRH